jgi:uncharacterized protein
VIERVSTASDQASDAALPGPVYAVEVAISAWWLRRYRHGPVEWLWRSLMYGAWQPMVLRRG